MIPFFLAKLLKQTKRRLLALAFRFHGSGDHLVGGLRDFAFAELLNLSGFIPYGLLRGEFI